MPAVRSPAQARALTAGWRAAGQSIGFVPTMGALHRGHLSLVAAALAENERTVVSIFVNPLQFGPGEDFDRYPRPLDEDLRLLREAGADAVYLPAQADMYPPGAATRVRVAGVGDVLEGEFRPGFFEGVATVVAKLFNTLRPDRAYFGQKDAQQAVVVQRLAADLDTGTEVRICRTVREADGLALSSRNAYLKSDERRAATCLHRALRTADDAYRAGERSSDRLRSAISAVIEAEPLARADYAEIVDPATFARAEDGLDGPARAVLAVRIGGTRLIDNHLLGSELD